MFIAFRDRAQRVLAVLPAATLCLAHQFRLVEMELSETKSEGIASTPWLCARLSRSLASLAVP